MDALTLIYIIVAALTGAAIAYFLVKGKKDSPAVKETTVAAPIINNDNSQKIKEYEQQICEREQETKALREKYETLLAKANEQIKQLDEQLQSSPTVAAGGNEQELMKQINKLKKEKEKLEDEIEEVEEKEDEYQKKLKKKDEAYNDLELNFLKVNREKQRISEDLDSLQEQLKEKEQQLGIKMESLQFMQEVLSAPQTDDADTQALYGKVDNLVAFIRGELKDCLKGISIRWNKEDEEKYFGISLTKWAIAKKKSWIQGKTTVAFVGEFSAGKTSIVNRILSQDDPSVPLLPVSTKATTAIPTYISGGVSTRYNFVSPDNLQKNIPESTFKRVSKEVLDQVKGVSSLIQYFVMAYNNPHLQNLSILDTPGFNSNDKEDAHRTIGVINECDALFWVFDVNAGTINKSSIQLIKENLRKPLYVVINKIDTKAPNEVNKVEQLIRKTLRDEGVAVQQFIRFSGKAPLDDIMQPIQSIRHDSGQDEYISTLLTWVEELKKQQYNIQQQANREQKRLFDEGDRLVDVYVEAIHELNNNCAIASNIPHYETHLFSSDKYEMSEDEYSQLVGTLSIIADNNVHELCELYDQQMEKQREAQQAYQDYRDKEAKYKSLRDCEFTLQKLIKKIV